MSILTYDDLAAAVTKWANRKDIDAGDMADAISIAETRMIRMLRIKVMEQSFAFVIDQNNDATVNLPTDYLELKSIFAESRPLEQITIEQYLTKRYDYPEPERWSGKPVFYARYPASWRCWPIPESSNGTGIYYRKPGALTSDNQTTPFFLKTTDAYLFGTLSEIMNRYGYDERFVLWERRFQQALGEVRQEDKIEEYSGSVTRIQPRKRIYYGY